MRVESRESRVESRESRVGRCESKVEIESRVETETKVGFRVEGESKVASRESESRERSRIVQSSELKVENRQVRVQSRVSESRIGV